MSTVWCRVPERVLSDLDMTPTQLRVVIALGGDRPSPWIERAAIMQMTGLDERQAKRALSALEQRGYVRRLRRPPVQGVSVTTLFAPAWVVGPQP